MRMEQAEIDTVDCARLNGNPCQLIAWADERITAHEHVGQSWTRPNDNGATIMWLGGGVSGRQVADWAATKTWGDVTCGEETRDDLLKFIEDDSR